MMLGWFRGGCYRVKCCARGEGRGITKAAELGLDDGVLELELLDVAVGEAVVLGGVGRHGAADGEHRGLPRRRHSAILRRTLMVA